MQSGRELPLLLRRKEEGSDERRCGDNAMTERRRRRRRKRSKAAGLSGVDDDSEEDGIASRFLLGKTCSSRSERSKYLTSRQEAEFSCYLKVGIIFYPQFQIDSCFQSCMCLIQIKRTLNSPS